MKKLFVLLFLFIGAYVFAQQQSFTQLESSVGQNRQRFEQEQRRLEDMSKTDSNERMFHIYSTRFKDLEDRISNQHFSINMAILASDPKASVTTRLDDVRVLLNRYAALESEYSNWVKSR